MIGEYKKLIGKQVDRFILAVFPPHKEEDFNQVDISAGFVFQDEPEKLCVISTDKDYLDRPSIYYYPLPKNCFGWNMFYSRMAEWMNTENDWIIDYEYYDATESSEFRHIVNNSILDVQLAFADQDSIPFGVKIIFDNDFLLSTPIIDGNTIETSFFNKHNNIEVFRSLGKVEFTSV
jgi:hypothetical protein